MNIGYKFTLWLLSLTEKLCKRYGIKGGPSSKSAIVYDHYKPIIIRSNRVMTKEMMTQMNSTQWVIDWMREEVAMELRQYVTVKATPRPEGGLDLEGVIAVYKKDAD